MESFKEWLLQAGKSPKTATSYVKNVIRCVAKEDPVLYIDSIKSKSHKAFVKSSWKSYQDFLRSQKANCTFEEKVNLFQIMKELDPKKVLSASCQTRKESFGHVVYQSQYGELILSTEQEIVLKKFSDGQILVVL